MPDDPRISKVPDTDRDAGSAEQAIIDARRSKAEQVRQRGDTPFANDVKARLGGQTHDIAEVRALADGVRDAAGKYDEAQVRKAAGEGLLHVRGRVVALRSTGGLSFLRLRDRTGELQLLVSQAVLGAEYE